MSALAEALGRVAAGPAEGLRAVGRALRAAALLTLAIVLLALAYVTWVRDLPVFGVSSVEVVGTDDGLIISTLTGVARDMTTLHVEQERFDEVAAHFPVIRAVHAETSFPTGIELMVEVREPAAVAKLADGRVPVAADGTLLPGVDAPAKLPAVRAEAKAGALVGEAADQVRVIGAAPAALVPLIEAVATEEESGIAVQMRGGVEIRFGTPSAAERKWAAAAAVLADDTLSALTYIDVAAPERPAVGGAVGGEPIEVEVEVAPTASTATSEAVADAAGVPAGEVSADPAVEAAAPTAAPSEVAPVEPAPAGAVEAP